MSLIKNLISVNIFLFLIFYPNSLWSFGISNNINHLIISEGSIRKIKVITNPFEKSVNSQGYLSWSKTNDNSIYEVKFLLETGSGEQQKVLYSQKLHKNYLVVDKRILSNLKDDESVFYIISEYNQSGDLIGISDIKLAMDEPAWEVIHDWVCHGTTINNDVYGYRLSLY